MQQPSCLSVCLGHSGATYMVTSIMGSLPKLSAASKEFSTSSLTVVYKLFPGCNAAPGQTRSVVHSRAELGKKSSRCQNQRYSCSLQRTLLETSALGRRSFEASETCSTSKPARIQAKCRVQYPLQALRLGVQRLAWNGASVVASFEKFKSKSSATAIHGMDSMQ